MIVNDTRTDKSDPWRYVIMTDGFMSGWGQAEGGTSYLAIAVSNQAEADIVLANARARHEMRQIRVCKSLPLQQIKPRDHLSIRDKSSAGRWFEPGAFKEDRPRRRG